MSSAAFLLPRPPPASRAAPGHVQPPRTRTAQAGGHQHARHPLAPETGSSCPQRRRQSRAEGCASQRGWEARSDGPHRTHTCSRARDELSIVLRPCGTTGVPSAEGKAAAQRCRGGWPGGHCTASRPGPSCLTFTQRSAQPFPASACRKHPAGWPTPPFQAARQQSSLWQVSLQHPAEAARPLAQRWHLPFLHLSWPRAGPQQKASPTLPREWLRRAGSHCSPAQPTPAPLTAFLQHRPWRG